jgi:hypothetical protein
LYLSMRPLRQGRVLWTPLSHTGMSAVKLPSISGGTAVSRGDGPLSRD